MIYRALDIAKYILNKCHAEKKYISNLQLQKILYFLQVEWLRTYNEVLFEDDIEAWHYGPVVPNVYHMYSGYGGMKITDYYEDFVLPSALIDEKLVDGLVNIYRSKPPWELVEESHKEGGSWDIVYNKDGHRSKICIDLIRELDLGNES